MAHVSVNPYPIVDDIVIGVVLKSVYCLLTHAAYQPAHNFVEQLVYRLHNDPIVAFPPHVHRILLDLLHHLRLEITCGDAQAAHIRLRELQMKMFMLKMIR